MRIWAAHPKPKEGELLSSWLIRLSTECGMGVREFCRYILSVKKPDLRHIDRLPDNQLLQTLSEGTGVPIERILETSHLAEEGRVISQRLLGAYRHWIIPAATLSEAKEKSIIGMAYCPQCLCTDEVPYYRKHWRYAFFPICTTHKTLLLSSCPSCNSPYSYILSAQKKWHSFQPITTCWFCGEDVRAVNSSLAWNRDLLCRTLSAQEYLRTGIEQGFFNTSTYGNVDSLVHLNLLYCITISLAECFKNTEQMNRIRRSSGIQFPEFRANPNRTHRDENIERRPADERAILICLARWILDDWVARHVYASGMRSTCSQVSYKVEYPRIPVACYR